LYIIYLNILLWKWNLQRPIFQGLYFNICWLRHNMQLNLLPPRERLNLNISYSPSYTVKLYQKYRYLLFIKINSLIYNLSLWQQHIYWECNLENTTILGLINFIRTEVRIYVIYCNIYKVFIQQWIDFYMFFFKVPLAVYRCYLSPKMYLVSNSSK